MLRFEPGVCNVQQAAAAYCLYLPTTCLLMPRKMAGFHQILNELPRDKVL